MTVDGDCPACGHPWVAHPVACLLFNACGTCMYEEDMGLRDEVCELIPPSLVGVPASELMRAIVVRSRLGLLSVRLLDSAGNEEQWGIQRIGWSTQSRADAVLRDVSAALQRLPVMDFKDWLVRQRWPR